MKLCDIVQFYSPTSGGVKRYINDKMHYLESRPDLRHVLIIPSKRDELREVGRTRIYGIKSFPLIGSGNYRMLTSWKKIRHIISEERPHLLEVEDSYWSAWIGLKAGLQWNLPVVAFYHSDYPRAFGDDIRRYLGSPPGRLVSRHTGRYLRGLHNRMDATIVATLRFERILTDLGIERIVRIPLCVDAEAFKPREGARKKLFHRLHLAEDTFLLLFVGRLAHMKNLESLFGMMDLLENEEQRFHLVIIGEGDTRDEVLEEVERRDHVTRLPYLRNPEELSEYYSASDLFVHAGLHETFGLVSLEAQACGTPVLCVRGGGMEETLEGEEPLIVAEDESPDSLAVQVRRICERRESKEDRERRRKRIVEHFSCERTFFRLTELYRRICGDGLRGKRE